MIDGLSVMPNGVATTEGQRDPQSKLDAPSRQLNELT
jgi:hypothetical protein